MIYPNSTEGEPTPWTNWNMTPDEAKEEINEWGLKVYMNTKESLNLQCSGWEIVLLPSGEWFFNDTTGG